MVTINKCLSHEMLTILLSLVLFASIGTSTYAQTVSYDYDGLNRMKRAEYLDGTVVDYNYDSTGNRVSIAHSLDTTPPTGTVDANSGVPATNSSEVILSLTCPDSTGCLQMQFSNDGTTYSAPEFYSGSKAWTLSSGSGNKTVYVRFRDKAGNWSAVQNTSILVDTTAPTTTFSPAGGTYTTAQSVTLTCSDGEGSGCAAIYYTTDGSNPTTASTVFSGPIAITSYVTLRFFSKDLAGNSESPQSVTYIVDSQAPSSSANPTSGNYITSQSVALSCSDGIGGSGCDKIYYTIDGSVPTTSSSIYSSPITISVPTTLRFFGTDLAGNSESPKTETYTIQTGLEIDSYTKLILHMDGTDGSTTFTDSSLSPKTVTRSGNAQIDTVQSKFGGASGLFDGSGDYLSLSDSADWATDSDFTWDGWVRFNTLPPSERYHICGQQYSNQLALNSSKKFFYQLYNGSTVLVGITGTTAVTTGVWYHVAVVRSGNTWTLYVNGVAEASSTNSTNYDSNRLFYVGGTASGTIYYLDGWIDELRISKGIARWTSNFTPPQGPYVSPPVTNAFPAGSVYSSSQTVTLTCSSGGVACDKIYYTTDGSTPTISSSVYASPISISSDTTLRFFGRDLAGNNELPKSETYTFACEPGIDSYTKLILHMDGADGATTFTDSSLSPQTVTAYGNAQLDTAQKRFGTSSSLFDGTGDYLSTPDSINWYFSGDFTIDCWIRMNAFASGSMYVIASQFNADESTGWYLAVKNTGGSTTDLMFRACNSGTWWASNYTGSGTLITTGTWHHVAVSKSGNTGYVFLDGDLLASLDWPSLMIPDSTGTLRIGMRGINGAEAYFNGWLDELRISKGIARWTSNFAPPQGPYTGE